MYPTGLFDYLHQIQILGTYNLNLVPKNRKNLYLAYYIFMFLVCQVYYPISEWSAFPKVYKNMESLIEHCGLVILRDAAHLKILMITIYRAKLANVEKTIEDVQYQYEETEDFHPGATMAACKKWLGRIITCFLLVGVLTLMSWNLVSASKFIQNGENFGKGNVSCDYFRHFHNSVPFPTQTLTQCKAAVAFQSILVLLPLVQIIASDLTVIALVVYIRGHFVNLSGAFRTFRVRCLRRLNLSEVLEVFQDGCNPVLKQEIHQEVVRMSKHLQVLIRLAADVEEIFNPTLLAQTMSTLCMLAACLFMMSSYEVTSVQFLAWVPYIIGLLMEFIPFCVLGNEITQQSAAVADAIWESDWLSCTKEVKSTIKIHNTRLQKPIHLTIGKFMPLSLTTFVSVVKGSYSYYTVLRSRNA